MPGVYLHLRLLFISALTIERATFQVWYTFYQYPKKNHQQNGYTLSLTFLPISIWVITKWVIIRCFLCIQAYISFILYIYMFISFICIRWISMYILCFLKSIMHPKLISNICKLIKTSNDI